MRSSSCEVVFLRQIRLRFQVSVLSRGGRVKSNLKLNLSQQTGVRDELGKKVCNFEYFLFKALPGWLGSDERWINPTIF